MEREGLSNLALSAYQVINVVTQLNRARIFEMVAHEKITFNGLRCRTGMSKSGLSTDILELAKLNLIVVRPSRREPVYYELTPLGKRIHSCLHLCESLLIQAPSQLERIVIGAEGFIQLFGKYEIETVKSLLKNKKIILPLRSYVKIVDWLDEKISETGDSKQLRMIEKMLYDERVVKVLENYDNLEDALDVECYMRRQKKLSPEQAELVAVAQDQDAAVVSTDERVISAAVHVGRQAFDLDSLLSYLKAEKLYRFATVETKREQLLATPLSVGGQEFTVFGPKRVIERDESSSASEYRTAILGKKYQIAFPVR